MKPYYDKDGITIYHGDCRDILPDLPKVDLVLTDPPYSDYVHRFAMRGTRNKNGDIFGESKDFEFKPLDKDEAQIIALQIGNVVKRWVLVFSDIESSPLWHTWLENAGLEYIRTGAWVKIAPTPQFSGDRPAVGFEAITIMHPKGMKSWNGGGSAAVWNCLAHGGERDIRYHKAQKPIELIHTLVSLFSNQDDLILDPFMGSGTTLRAAKDLGRKAIGIEIEEKYCEIAVKRLAQEAMNLKSAGMS